MRGSGKGNTNDIDQMVVFHDADARGGAKSKHHPFLTRKDPFFNAQRFQNIVATYALGRATDLQPISGLLVLAVFIDAKIRVFLLRVLMRYCCFFSLLCLWRHPTTYMSHEVHVC